MLKSEHILQEIEAKRQEIEEIQAEIDELHADYAEAMAFESQNYGVGCVYEHSLYEIEAVIVMAGIVEKEDGCDLLYSLISLETGNRFYEPSTLEELKNEMVEEGRFNYIGHISDYVQSKNKQKEKVELIYDETCNTIDVVVDDEYISVFDLEVGSNALKYEIIEEISDLLNYFGIEHKLKKVE
ncbi:MAG: hypothetical protein PUD99_07565 [Turicibacter sp.]|jgi:hypothetical protein|nr:hypothetical protein [Turicibacter sp.]